MSEITALDGSWAAIDTIHSWEANDCAASARDDFPNWGDYANIPQFSINEVTTIDWDGVTETSTSSTCYVTD